MEIDYNKIQAVRYELAQLIKVGQGDLLIENANSDTMGDFLFLFQEKFKKDPSIQALFDFIESHLRKANIKFYTI